MKKTLKTISLLLTSFISAQKTEDQKAIKSMCGCYEVQFNFAETFKYPKDETSYKPSPIKQEKALEWIELIEDQPNKLSLQHLLIAGNDLVIKHWRQDWLYENTDFYDYNGFNDWKYKKRSKDEVKGQWTQKVYEVDDSPRYEGSASWIHTDGRHFWENTTNAPLPRREYTQRKDYNITKRTSVHEITNFGWIHDQDNAKTIREENGNEYVIAKEKGQNTYKKVDDSKCAPAQKWWNENKDYWSKVRVKWNDEFAKNKDLKLKKDVDGKQLYMYLQSMKKDASQSEINAVIEQFIRSK